MWLFSFLDFLFTVTCKINYLIAVGTKSGSQQMLNGTILVEIVSAWKLNDDLVIFNILETNHTPKI